MRPESIEPFERVGEAFDWWSPDWDHAGLVQLTAAPERKLKSWAARDLIRAETPWPGTGQRKRYALIDVLAAKIMDQLDRLGLPAPYAADLAYSVCNGLHVGELGIGKPKVPYECVIEFEAAGKKTIRWAPGGRLGGLRHPTVVLRLRDVMDDVLAALGEMERCDAG